MDNFESLRKGVLDLLQLKIDQEKSRWRFMYQEELVEKLETAMQNMKELQVSKEEVIMMSICRRPEPQTMMEESGEVVLISIPVKILRWVCLSIMGVLILSITVRLAWSFR
jgi:hypothetical protein